MAERKTKTTTSKKKPAPKPSPSSGLFQSFWRSSGGRALKTLIAAIIVVLLDLLVTRNQFSTFFLLLGIELLLVFAFILLYLAWQQRNVDRNRQGK